MKSGMVFSVLFILIIAGGIWTQAYLDKSAHALDAEASGLIEQVKAESWDQAAETVSALNTRWQKEKKRWLLLVEHEKIDLIDEAIHEALMMIAIQEKPHSMEALGQLTFHIMDVPDKGRMDIANIF